MTPKPLYVDRSRYIDGQNCQRLRGLAFEAPNAAGEVQGWSPSRRPHYYEVGSTLHEALEQVLMGVSPVEAAKRVWAFVENLDGIQFGQGEGGLPPDLAAREAATWIEAAMWCFVIERLPYYLETYEVVAVEKELQMPLGDVTCSAPDSFARTQLRHYANGLDGELCQDCAGTDKRPIVWLSRPDVILRRKVDGSLFVMDFKSSGFKEDAASLDNTLQHKVLVYAQIAAVEAAMGEPCVGYIYEGFYKGSNREDKRLGFKRRYSPLAWAYCAPADGLTKASVDAENWRLGNPRLLADLPGWSIESYVREALTPEQRQAQLMTTEPIGADPTQVERWRKQVLAEEAKWQAWRAQGASLEELPQNDDHCMRYRGEPCTFFKACWDFSVRRDPVGSGFFTARSANHQPERGAE